jgi:hypothetical protein
MDLETSLDDFVLIPASYIRSPGFLLKDKKDPMQVKANPKHMQNLLQIFKQTTDTTIGSFLPPLDLSIDHNDKLSFLNESLSSPDDLSKLYTSENRSTPGKLKSSSDEILRIIKKAKEILSIYEVNLIINLNDQLHKEAANLLKYLVPEICSLPNCFFKKMQIKNFVICKEATRDFASPMDIFFPIIFLETKEKFQKRLYKIIFEHMVKGKPDLLKEWNKAESNDRESSESQVEEIFMRLMKNTKQALIRPKIVRLKGLISKYYPELMSEQFFISEINEKKKILKVQFRSDQIKII